MRLCNGLAHETSANDYCKFFPFGRAPCYMLLQPGQFTTRRPIARSQSRNVRVRCYKRLECVWRTQSLAETTLLEAASRSSTSTTSLQAQGSSKHSVSQCPDKTYKTRGMESLRSCTGDAIGQKQHDIAIRLRAGQTSWITCCCYLPLLLRLLSSFTPPRSPHATSQVHTLGGSAKPPTVKLVRPIPSSTPPPHIIAPVPAARRAGQTC